MSYCDFEGPEFFMESKRKARKSHTCCECGVKILPGEHYFLSRGKWDGEISSFKQHPWCRAACTHLSKQNYDGCIAFGAMFEEWGETEHWKIPKGSKLRRYMARVKIEIRKRKSA